ncbi:hypothetical protein [Xanthomonas sp. 3498]|uniref:hypothetical protein n=1 Tax=Xanthomonas sp. 3498 TaxID=2663863 RepID=UPI00161862D8|nr:hypothetical protein [Xanthomonas sp. 3498]MBB5877637.1 hypothetical protein [Xanthomonas sp. 3498]
MKLLVIPIARWESDGRAIRRRISGGVNHFNEMLANIGNTNQLMRQWSTAMASMRPAIGA